MAAPAYAATITVTTANDVVDGGDGLTSLREAISQANAAAEATTIELAAGTYSLSLCGADEDANASGDLDYTGAQVLTIAGNSATIEQTCASQRLLHAINGTSGVVLQSLTLTSGEQIVGAAVAWANDLTLQGVTVSGNDAGGGAVLSSDDMFAMGPALYLIDSTVGPNTGTGVRVSLGSVSLTGSTLTGNTLRGAGLIDGALTVSGSTVQGNGTDGLSTTGQGEGLFAISDSEITGNGGVGVICSACGHLEVTDSVISGNAGGVVVNVDQDEASDDLHISIDNSTVASNTKTGAGGGLGVFILELSPEAPAAQILLNRSTFSGNAANGMDGRGGAVFAATGEVRAGNSTVDGNTAAVTGGGIFSATGDVFLQHATITRNSAPAGANIGTGEDLNAFASIVASAAGGGDDCAISGTTLSSGYNVGGDTSCAFVGGPGDLTNAGDPKLGPLQENGGATKTRLPEATSPALGLVPAAACTVLTIDQRGLARPQGPARDAGSAEIAEAGGGGGGGLPVTGPDARTIILFGGLVLLAGAVLLTVTRRRLSGRSLEL